jgi:uncharacterized membrane protein
VSERSLRLSIGAVAVAGIGLAAYLLYARETGAQLVCHTGGCETVQSSRYSELFGVPVAALGLASYIWLLLASCSRSELARAAQAVVALAACAFSTYLVFVQLHLIGAVCELCLVSDGLIAVATVLVLLRLRGRGVASAYRDHRRQQR